MKDVVLPAEFCEVVDSSGPRMKGCEGWNWKPDGYEALLDDIGTLRDNGILVFGSPRPVSEADVSGMFKDLTKKSTVPEMCQRYAFEFIVSYLPKSKPPYCGLFHGPSYRAFGLTLTSKGQEIGQLFI